MTIITIQRESRVPEITGAPGGANTAYPKFNIADEALDADASAWGKRESTLNAIASMEIDTPEDLVRMMQNICELAVGVKGQTERRRTDLSGANGFDEFIARNEMDVNMSYLLHGVMRARDFARAIVD